MKKPVIAHDEGRAIYLDDAMMRCSSGRLWTFHQTKTGGWEEVTVNQKTGRLNKVEGGGYGLRIGEREKYHDFSF